MIIGLRWRVAAVMLAIILVGDWWLVQRSISGLHQRYQEAMEDGLVETAGLLAAQAEIELRNGRAPQAQLASMMTTLADHRLAAPIYDHLKTNFVTGIYLTDASGTVLYHSVDQTQIGRDFSKWNDVARTLAGKYGARATRSNPQDEYTAVLHVAAPVRKDGHVVGVLTVFRPVDAVTPLLLSARSNLIWTGLAAAGAATVVVVMCAWWITRPIRRLTLHVEAVTAGQRPPLPALGGDEIAKLGSAFQTLCASLDGRAYIERYVQTLTHELKSPLAAIRGAAELLDEEIPQADRQRFLANIRTETARVQDLAERLLELSALERRTEALQAEEIDVAALISDVVESLRPQALAKSLQIVCETTPGLALRGERFLIRQAVANVLQNAIGFSPVGGSIRITAQPHDGLVTLSIRDHGPGIPDFARKRIFERFFSLARPDTGRKSTGLGLPFVHEVVQRHGGKISLSNHPDGGAVAELRLPGMIGHAVA